MRSSAAWLLPACAGAVLLVGLVPCAATSSAASSLRLTFSPSAPRSQAWWQYRRRAAQRHPRGKLIWHDEFRGPAGALPSSRNWTYDLGNGGWGNHELETYTDNPTNVQLDGHGHLVITAIKSSDGTYTSARVKTQRKFSFRYGTVSARIELPAGQGLWPAFWLLGKSIKRIGWPACGEIDVMELLGNDTHTAYGHIHGPGPRNDTGYGGAYHSTARLTGSFHVYTARWTPSEVAFLVDGHAYVTVRRSEVKAPNRWAVDQPMFLILNLAVGGDWGGNPNSSTQFPAQVAVDWVRVTSPKG